MSQDAPHTLNRLEIISVLLEAADHTVIPLLVTGTSMKPFLLDRRSVVYLEKDTDYTPKRGDILFFARPDDTVVLHRLVKCLNDGTLLINGDAQSWTEIIHPRQILAHVTHLQRKKKKISVGNRFYRLLVWLWMPLRPLHPHVVWLHHAVRRVPYKLFPKLMSQGFCERNGHNGYHDD